MSKKDIEARLDRSLANQIRVPQLDRRFDAAVWARIAAADAKVTNPVATLATDRAARAMRASRWLAIINVIGATVVIGLLAYFGFKVFGGASPEVNLPGRVELPTISLEMVVQGVVVFGYVLGLATFVLAIGVTPMGRRLRSAFS